MYFVIDSKHHGGAAVTRTVIRDNKYDRETEEAQGQQTGYQDAHTYTPIGDSTVMLRAAITSHNITRSTDGYSRKTMDTSWHALKGSSGRFSLRQRPLVDLGVGRHGPPANMTTIECGVPHESRQPVGHYAIYEQRNSIPTMTAAVWAVDSYFGISHLATVWVPVAYGSGRSGVGKTNPELGAYICSGTVKILTYIQPRRSDRESGCINRVTALLPDIIIKYHSTGRATCPACPRSDLASSFHWQWKQPPMHMCGGLDNTCRFCFGCGAFVLWVTSNRSVMHSLTGIGFSSDDAPPIPYKIAKHSPPPPPIGVRPRETPQRSMPCLLLAE